MNGPKLQCWLGRLPSLVLRSCVAYYCRTTLRCSDFHFNLFFFQIIIPLHVIGLSCGCVSWGLPNISNLPCNKRYLTWLLREVIESNDRKKTKGKKTIGYAEWVYERIVICGIKEKSGKQERVENMEAKNLPNGRTLTTKLTMYDIVTA